MIREDLLEFQYYIDRLSKFMQESYGIDEQIRTYHSLLTQIDTFYNKFLNEVRIFDNAYPDYNEVLNNLGKIFNCQRNFTIPVYGNINQPFVVTGYEKVELNNDEYLIYIKTQIIKQNFDGRRSTLRQLYTTFDNNKLIPGILDLIFLYTTTDSGSFCEIRWNIENPSSNLRKLFENGYLTIESMGIQYRRSIENFDRFSYFAQRRYENLESEPEDWNTNTYYSIIANPATSEFDSNNTYAILDGNDWIILEHEPVNWEEGVYNNYKIITVAPVPQGTTFEGNTYFQYNPLKTINLFNQEQYHLLSTEPQGWGTKTYYQISSTSAGQNFDPTNIYGKEEDYGYSILTNEPVSWEENNIYSTYKILTITPVSSGTSFVSDTYYSKEEIGGILI